jgi:phenylpropionate dioxygenase-like ring-hydroxylating dioxygenase large terminal subunit
MLSKRDNQEITRVGPTTPLGKMFRRYWVPALLSEEIPEPDCPPVRVKLLGEDLVAFRDSSGQVGLIGEYCPHRLASLFYGRNENCGLVCIYHGWKFDTEGNLLETPAEPPRSKLKEKIHHIAYPCREASGVVFTYMGPKDKRPLFPNYDWLNVPPDHVRAWKFRLDCNYLQSLEGDCDPSHLTYLHRGNPGFPSSYTVPPSAFKIEETRYGLRNTVTKRLPSGKEFIRITNFVFPFIACVEVGYPDGFQVIYQTPADDTHTNRFNLRFRKHEPLSQEQVQALSKEVRQDYRLVAKKRDEFTTDFAIDREKQRLVNYAGLDGFVTQDACMTESMGPIVDRSKERLGVGDTYIIKMRKRLLSAVRAFRQGKEPPGLVWDAKQNSFADIYCEDTNRPVKAAS